MMGLPRIGKAWRHRPFPPRSAPGFILLEVMVAFAIAALAVGVLARAALSGVTLAQTNARYDQALAQARSRLAMAVHMRPLNAGDWDGEDQGYRWRVNVAPLAAISVPVDEAFARQGASESRLLLYSVSVRVSWRDGAGSRQVRLATEQIGDAVSQGAP